MIKERPPSQGGPPQQNTGSTLPLGVNGTGCYSSAVTASTLAIEALANFQIFSPGANGDHQNDKTKKPTYYRMCVDSYADIDPRLDDGSRRLLGVMLSLKRSDVIIIAGKEKLAFYLSKSPRRIYVYLRRLCAAGYLRLVKKGGGYPGNADAYSLGVMYNLEKAEWCAIKLKEKGQEWAEIEKERWSKMTSFDGERWPEIDTKVGNRLPSHPIDTITNTHTYVGAALPPPFSGDSVSNFCEESWIEYCTQKYPDWELADIKSSFQAAVIKGIGSGNWKAYADKCYASRRLTAVAHSPSKEEWLGYAFIIDWPVDDALGAWDHYECVGWELAGGLKIKDWRERANYCHGLYLEKSPIRSTYRTTK